MPYNDLVDDLPPRGPPCNPIKQRKRLPVSFPSPPEASPMKDTTTLEDDNVTYKHWIEPMPAMRIVAEKSAVHNPLNRRRVQC